MSKAKLLVLALTALFLAAPAASALVIQGHSPIVILLTYEGPAGSGPNQSYGCTGVPSTLPCSPASNTWLDQLTTPYSYSSGTPSYVYNSPSPGDTTVTIPNASPGHWLVTITGTGTGHYTVTSVTCKYNTNPCGKDDVVNTYVLSGNTKMNQVNLQQIILSQNGSVTLTTPEFPLGITVLMAVAFVGLLAFRKARPSALSTTRG